MRYGIKWIIGWKSSLLEVNYRIAFVSVNGEKPMNQLIGDIWRAVGCMTLKPQRSSGLGI